MTPFRNILKKINHQTGRLTEIREYIEYSGLTKTECFKESYGFVRTLRKIGLENFAVNLSKRGFSFSISDEDLGDQCSGLFIFIDDGHSEDWLNIYHQREYFSLEGLPMMPEKWGIYDQKHRIQREFDTPEEFGEYLKNHYRDHGFKLI